MKQHRSFKKDMDLLSEAYGRIGGIHMSDLAQQAAGHLAAEDGEDKTGQLSDKEIVARAEKMGTAGREEIDAAKKRLDAGESLTPEQRTALARDVYGHAEQDIARDRHHGEEDESRKERRNVDEYEYEQGKEAGEHASDSHFVYGDWVNDSDGTLGSIIGIEGDEVSLYDGRESWTTHISEIKHEGADEGLYPKSLGSGGSITSSQKFL